MAPWRRHPTQHVRDVASYLGRASEFLQRLAAAYEARRQGRLSADELTHRIRAEREQLDILVISVAAVGATRDPADPLHLERHEKSYLVRLIEDTLFAREMKAYPTTDQQITGDYPPTAELFAVLAFRNLYRDALSAH
jgi:hypothetical protein